MKLSAVTILSFFMMTTRLFAQSYDTTIGTLLVQFHYDTSIFPESWRADPIRAGGEQIAAEEIQRTIKIVGAAIAKYPAGTLEQNLKTVYYLKTMKFYEVGYGGTNSTDALYLTNDGAPRGYTDFYIEQTFHHEFSSILIRNYPAMLDTASWSHLNAGLDYNDPEYGVGAIRSNQASQLLDTSLCAKGLLTHYAMSGMENDVNTFAQNLFCPSDNFWPIVDSFPLIRKKADLLINFYHELNPAFTEEYFRSLIAPG